MRRSARFAGLALTAVAFLAACGSDNKSASVETTAPAAQALAPEPTTTAPANFGGTVAVKSNATDLGPVLAGPDGRTLYGFINDVNATSTCYGTCAEAWPPVIVQPNWTVGPGLDNGVFSTVIRDDGHEQLVAGKFPLYYFSGDSAPGDLNGRGSGDVWFAMNTSARLIQNAPAPATTTAPTTAPAKAPATTAPPAAAAGASVKLAKSGLGDILVDADGRTLYAFLKDVDGKPTCQDACAKAWPAALVSGKAVAGEGIDANIITTVATPDGKTQLKAGKWPLYRFSGDAAAGDTNGQGSGGNWFVVGKDGKPIK
jgi:predicted lipoprotein with Yx(FWY)xxD motif